MVTANISGAESWEIRIPSHVQAGQRVVEDFMKRIEARGVRPNEMLALRHGIHEAIINAIRHGNGGDPSRHVRVAYQFTGNLISIEVEDEGPGFERSRVSDPTSPENVGRPGGRGLLMMQHFMNSVEFHGNRVVMRRTVACD